MVDEPWNLAPPSPGTWLVVVTLAVFSTALACIIYFRVLASSGATNILLVTFLVPVSAVLLGTMLLNESLLLRHLIGMGFIGAGLAAIDGRPLTLLRDRLSTVSMRH